MSGLIAASNLSRAAVRGILWAPRSAARMLVLGARRIFFRKLLEEKARRERVREKKRAFWATKREVRAAHGRRPVRQKARIKSKDVRGKFEPVEWYVPTCDLTLPDGFEPHHGNHPLGLWQRNFLVKHGLEASHRLLDLGCGDLKGGIPLIRYLGVDRYIGLDQSIVALEQGMLSLGDADWAKYPRFLAGGDFAVENACHEIDVIWAHSVLTHVDLSMAGKCMASAFHVLAGGGCFLATFFRAPEDDPWLATPEYRAASEAQPDAQKRTYSYRNPFHHRTQLLIEMAQDIGFRPTVLDEITPKGQHILDLRRPA